MSVDLRGFSYALEPLRQQRQWRLDRLLVQLGSLQTRIHEIEKELEQRNESFSMLSRDIGLERSKGISQSCFSLQLHWLVRLKTEILGLQDDLFRLREERVQLRAKCLVQQYKLDVLDTHRKDCIAEFSVGETNRMAKEADRDWLTMRSRRSEFDPKSRPKLRKTWGGA
ncbi:hypothetical protein [Holophaga foetida]|uniref:hypothetical protein n=1 Tax=Holophaga foetida TaxID=35839 RepID=UPI0002474651|nr:hypothetical protein [Holophaga foetida]